MLQKITKQQPHHFVLATSKDMALNDAMSHMRRAESLETDKNIITNEDLLVSIGRDQNRNSFIALFNYFAPRLKSFLIKGGLTSETAEEVSQETMLIVWNKAKSFDPKKASASTWIYTIARNKKIDAFRKMNRPEYDPLDPLLDIDSSSETQMESLNHKQNSVVLKDVIQTLPEDQSELIKKAFYEDKTHQAIAEELDIPLGTVKSRIRLGMERLRHSLTGKLTKESLS